MPDHAIRANLRQALLVRDDELERRYWLQLGVPDVDHTEAQDLLLAAEAHNAAGRRMQAEARLSELLELQRDAERALAEAVETAGESVDAPVDRPVDNLPVPSYPQAGP